MTTGPLFKMLLTYSLPVIAMGVLQCLYNAADMVVAGKFAGSQALAAVGSTGSLVNLVVALFIGISLGVNVTVARYFGARDFDAVADTVHTAMLFSVRTTLPKLLLTDSRLITKQPLLSLIFTRERASSLPFTVKARSPRLQSLFLKR